MLSWKEERDRLVAQTVAFVQQVAAAHPRTMPSVPIEPAASEPASPVITVADVVTEPVASAKPLLAAMPAHAALYSTVSARADITQRVAAFKARQGQLSREREAYYDSMQARIRNELGNVSDADRL